MAAMDPDVAHWSQASGSLSRIPADLVYGYQGNTGVILHPFWTSDGHFPYKGNDTPEMVGGDFVSVQITIAGPGKGGLQPGLSHDHAHTGLTANGKATGDKPWDPPKIFTLRDGSTVKEYKEQDSAGAEYLLIRTLPSGQQLVLQVDGPFSSTGNPSTNQLPFTENQVIAAVSVSGIEDVRLPVPGFP
jgi:hypothetical protein